MRGIIFLLLWAIPATAQLETATYFGWGMVGPNGGLHCRFTPSDFTWTGIKYAIKFAESENIYTAAPYWGPRVATADVFTDSVEWYHCGHGNPGQGDKNWHDTLITAAHANNAYVVEDIHQVGSVAGWNYVTADSARFEVFIESVRSACELHGSDGVELNIEQWAGSIASLPNHLRGLRQIRRAMNRLTAFDGSKGKFFCCAPVFDGPWYPASADTCWDVLAINAYSYYGATYSSCGGNQAWPPSPLHRGTDWCPVHNEAGSIVEGQFFNNGGSVTAWIAAHDKSKIMLGINSYGLIYAGVSDIRTTGQYGQAEMFYDEYAALTTKGGTLVRDTDLREEYIHGTNNTGSSFTVGSVSCWWTPTTTITNGQAFTAVCKSAYAIQEDVAWATQQGIKGIWVFDAWKDRNNTASGADKNPLHKALADAIAQYTQISNPCRGVMQMVKGAGQ